jgi:hypothetical protein
MPIACPMSEAKRQIKGMVKCVKIWKNMVLAMRLVFVVFVFLAMEIYNTNIDKPTY